MEVISEKGGNSLDSEAGFEGPSPARSNSMNASAPRPPKRKSTMKKVASRLHRATSSSSLWGQNTPTIALASPVKETEDDSVVEFDGVFKSKDKNKKATQDGKLAVTPETTPKVLSPMKRFRKQSMGGKMKPFGPKNMRRTKSVIETPTPQQMPILEISEELNYREIVAEMKQNETDNLETRKRAPTQPWVMEIEYGKADIDSVEYGHDMIIQEIESGFFLGPVLRAVYEGNDHAKFLDRLDCRIKQHDRDIERMCNFHYQGFIESITELINVRSDAERLKNQTVVINKELQESGKEVARKSDDLIQCQLQQRNVASAIEKLSMCLPVLQMYAKMCEQMKAGRYYSALKTLEQLERTHLPLIFQYRFCEIMSNNIPRIREEIKDISMKELKDFLESVRKNSDKIGMVAMKQVEKERGLNLVTHNQSDKSLDEEESPAEADIPMYDYNHRLQQQKLSVRRNQRTVNGQADPKRPNLHQSASPIHRRKMNPFEEEPDVHDTESLNNPFEDSNPFLSAENGDDLNPFAEEDHVEQKGKPRSSTYVNHSLVNELSHFDPTDPMKEAKYELGGNSKAGELENKNATMKNANPFQLSEHLAEDAKTADSSNSDQNPFTEQTSSQNPFETKEIETNPFTSEKTDSNPFQVVEPNPFENITSQNPFEVEETQIENVDNSKNPFESDATLGQELDTNAQVSPGSQSLNCDLEPALSNDGVNNPFLADMDSKNEVNSAVSSCKMENQDVENKTNEASVPPQGEIKQHDNEPLPVKAPPRRRKKRAPLSPPDNSCSKNGTENKQAQSSFSGNNSAKDMILQKSESEKPQIQTAILKDVVPSVSPDNSTKSSLGSEKVVEFQFCGTDKQGSLVFDHRHKEIQEKRAKLVEDMVSPKWRKTRDWNMPRIYQDLSASDLVDFSPVYKCLHIFGLVGSQAQFETYYRTQRKNQARLVLEPPASMQDNPDAFAKYFYQIVGFFVVEDHVLHTAPNLISRQVLDDLWEMALSKLVAVLQTDSVYCSDAISMMKVKNLIVIFADTLKAYGFPVSRLFGLLMEMRDSYGEILLKHWSKKFMEIFDEDNYTAMLLDNEAEVKALLETFPYESPGFESEKYPRKLPFSRFVPRIFGEMKRFILSCLEYCEDLHLSSTEVDDMIRKSTNLLLTRTLASSLQTLVQKPSLGLTELVQIIVNTTHLENSCQHIEEFVHSITGVRVGSAHSAKLVGVSTFKDARNGTEEQIYIKLNSKIDEFFELGEYDWGVKEPQGRASRYLLDLIAFLQHNFEVFTNLPSKVAQTACMSACRHISARLMELVLDKDIKVVTMAALQQFNLDVMQCELFSNSEPVPGFRDGALQMSFVELRQLLDLFLSWDWSSYLADYGSGNSKYLRVSPGTALTLLEKIKEERGHRNIFASLSKQEREKKKLLETVVRQLRGIVNDWSLLCVPHRKLTPKKRRGFLRM